MTAAPKLATYEELIALPEEERLEILGGEVVAQSSPIFDHSYARGTLIEVLRGPFERRRGGPGGWWIVPDIDVRFTDHDVVRPDVVGWRRERLPSPWGRRPIDVVPDWIAEVLSPFGVQRDRVIKMQLYARHGVPFYWIVDPVERVLEAYAREGGRWAVTGMYDHTAVVQIPPFEAIEFEVGDLFRAEEPQAE